MSQWGGFGATTTQPSAFGAPGGFGLGASQAPATGAFGASPFGATSTAPTNTFGAPATTTPFGGFGAQPAAAQSGFGGFSQPAATPFGASAAPQGGMAGGVGGFGGFGAPAAGQPSVGLGGFGATAPTSTFGAAPTGGFGTTTASFGNQAAGGFGATTFGNQQPANTGGMFGGTAFGATQQATPAGGTQFGNPFGAPAQTAPGGFGAVATSQPLSGGFGATPGFGGAANQGFGAAAATPGFGNVATTQAFGGGFSTPSTGGFGTSFGAQAPNPYGQQAPVGAGRVGTAQVAYRPTRQQDNTGNKNEPFDIIYITGMPEFSQVDKSIEELRFEDYQAGVKGPAPGTQAPSMGGFGTNLGGNLLASGFGATNPSTTSAFGTGFGQQPAVSTAQSVFGQPSTTTTSSFFGAATTQPGTSNFGAATTGFGGFGSNLAASTPGTGGFGGFNAQKPGGFGLTATTQPQSATTGGFGSFGTTSGFGGGTGFGTTGFGTGTGFGQQPATTSAFGTGLGLGAATSQPGTSTPSLFGQQPTTSTAFGSTLPTSQGFGGFGTPANTAAGFGGLTSTSTLGGTGFGAGGLGAQKPATSMGLGGFGGFGTSSFSNPLGSQTPGLTTGTLGAQTPGQTGLGFGQTGQSTLGFGTGFGAQPQTPGTFGSGLGLGQSLGASQAPLSASFLGASVAAPNLSGTPGAAASRLGFDVSRQFLRSSAQPVDDVYLPSDPDPMFGSVQIPDYEKMRRRYGWNQPTTIARPITGSTVATTEEESKALRRGDDERSIKIAEELSAEIRKTRRASAARNTASFYGSADKPGKPWGGLTSTPQAEAREELRKAVEEVQLGSSKRLNGNQGRYSENGMESNDGNDQDRVRNGLQSLAENLARDLRTPGRALNASPAGPLPSDTPAPIKNKPLSQVILGGLATPAAATPGPLNASELGLGRRSGPTTPAVTQISAKTPSVTGIPTKKSHAPFTTISLPDSMNEYEFPGAYTRPDLATLNVMDAHTLEAVDEFIAGVKDQFEIKFLDPVDLTRDGPLHKLFGRVIIYTDNAQGVQVTVYPHQDARPPAGEGLNVRALIGVRAENFSQAAPEAFRRALARRAQKKGHKFIGWDEEKGWATFEMPAFDRSQSPVKVSPHSASPAKRTSRDYLHEYNKRITEEDDDDLLTERSVRRSRPVRKEKAGSANTIQFEEEGRVPEPRSDSDSFSIGLDDEDEVGEENETEEQITSTYTLMSADCDEDQREDLRLMELQKKGKEIAGYGMQNILIDPPISELQRLSPEKLKHVSKLRIRCPGFGSLEFLEPVDLSKVDFDKLDSYVLFYDGSVEVYPEQSSYCPPGTGLNKKCCIRLYNVFPDRRRKNYRLYDSFELKDYERKLKAVPETEFKQYIPRIGGWKFVVNHFSKYEAPVETLESEKIKVR